MACTTAITSVSNTINKLYIQSDLNLFYKKNFYHYKQNIMDELFHQFHLPLLKYIGHTEFITQWKQNLDSAAYENNINKEIKLPPKKKEICRHDIMTY